MSIYRKRSVQKIEAEIDYISHQITKTMDGLEKLENKLNYLRSELDFNKKEKVCSHSKTFTYNHGYHTVCQDCGEELA
jgi:septal ring factor EnvC (AmiA/AmiB activator)